MPRGILLAEMAVSFRAIRKRLLVRLTELRVGGGFVTVAVNDWIIVSENQGDTAIPTSWAGENGTCAWCGDNGTGYLMSQIVQVASVSVNTHNGLDDASTRWPTLKTGPWPARI